MFKHRELLTPHWCPIFCSCLEESFCLLSLHQSSIWSHVIIYEAHQQSLMPKPHLRIWLFLPFVEAHSVTFLHHYATGSQVKHPVSSWFSFFGSFQTFLDRSSYFRFTNKEEKHQQQAAILSDFCISINMYIYFMSADGFEFTAVFIDLSLKSTSKTHLKHNLPLTSHVVLFP